MAITNICIIDTPYALLVYTMYMSKEEIDKTFFICGENINYEILEFLKYKMQIKRFKTKYFSNVINYFYFKYKIQKINHIFPNKIYAQDNILFAPLVIKKSKYTLIEDSPLICSIYSKSKKKNHKNLKSFILRLLYGEIHFNCFGNNEQCDELLLTQDDNADYIQNKKKTLVKINYKWSNFNDKHRQFILNLFGLKLEDINLLKSKKYILFTQPLTDFKCIDYKTQELIYRKILSNYEEGSVLIKVHPRDKLNYREIFPKYKVFSKKIPSQLLELVGIQYEKAITVFSTAAITTKGCKDVDWYGTRIHQELYNEIGDKPNPLKKCSFE